MSVGVRGILEKTYNITPHPHPQMRVGVEGNIRENIN
jgi:hypothetical protein